MLKKFVFIVFIAFLIQLASTSEYPIVYASHSISTSASCSSNLQVIAVSWNAVSPPSGVSGVEYRAYLQNNTTGGYVWSGGSASALGGCISGTSYSFPPLPTNYSYTAGVIPYEYNASNRCNYIIEPAATRAVTNATGCVSSGDNPPPATCGNSTCAGEESCNNCPQDCGGCAAPNPSPSPSPSASTSTGGTTSTCSSSTSCDSCVSTSGCGWSGPRTGGGGSCISGTNSCGGRTEFYYSSCSDTGNLCNACANVTGYTISGKVANGVGTGIPGATVCLDPVGNCTSSTATAITNTSGNYTFNNVVPGGNGHTVYVQPDNFTVSNNSQTVSGSTCQATSINFTVTPTSATGQGYLVAYEKCVSGAWQSIGNKCSAECGTPGPSCTPTPPYYCSSSVSSLPSNMTCTIQGDKTCASSSNNCYRCVQPPSTGTTSPTAPSPAAPPPGTSVPWIQTSGGDVHSNTRIDVP